VLRKPFSCFFSAFPSREFGVYSIVNTLLTSSALHSIASLIASLNLFKAALKAVLRSPTSFFDTTPMGNLSYLPNELSLNYHSGRILSRLSKDQDTLDTELSMTLMQV
jgi:ATP-binding cassette subfamily C (CFTR/MRP) protein 1